MAHHLRKYFALNQISNKEELNFLLLLLTHIIKITTMQAAHATKVQRTNTPTLLLLSTTPPTTPSTTPQATVTLALTYSLSL